MRPSTAPRTCQTCRTQQAVYTRTTPVVVDGVTVRETLVIVKAHTRAPRLWAIGRLWAAAWPGREHQPCEGSNAVVETYRAPVQS